MAKKPTWETGHIAFGKDGSVHKHTERLPETKEGQELGVTLRFLEMLEKQTGERLLAKQLSENDNDFMLAQADGDADPVTLELTEAAFAQWARELTREDWIEGRHNYREFVMPAPDRYFGVDIAKRDAALANLLRKKRAKNYSRPREGKFWLLIWTVGPGLLGPFMEGGELRWSAAFAALVGDLAAEGPGPFDTIWLFQHPDFLDRVWPIETAPS